MAALPLGLGGLISVTTTCSSTALSGQTGLGKHAPPLCQEMRGLEQQACRTHTPPPAHVKAATQRYSCQPQRHTASSAIRASLTIKQRRVSPPQAPPPSSPRGKVQPPSLQGKVQPPSSPRGKVQPPSSPRRKLQPPPSQLPTSRRPLGAVDCNVDLKHVEPLIEASSRRLVKCATIVVGMPGGDRARLQQSLGGAPAAPPLPRSTASRTPLKPKVASSSSSSSTPLARRRQAGRDEGLASSSTPPSLVGRAGGSRLSRGDSAYSTPGDRTADSWGESGYETNVDGRDVADSGSKFFYASQAKAIQRPLSVPQKPVPFFYANETKRAEQSGPRFLHANGAREAPLMRPILSGSMSASVVPTASIATASSISAASIAASRPSTSASANGVCFTSRPLSPIKSASTPAPMHTIYHNSPPHQPSVLTESPPTMTTTIPKCTVAKRRISLDAMPRTAKRGHARTNSATSLDTLPLAALTASPSSSQASSAPRSPTAPPMTMASILQAADELRERQRETGSSPSHAVEPVSELVANARRERKVQDLEITNASLEAINRTLERQLRKQTAEMRRYRRLSRTTSRKSFASVASGSRVSSAALTDPLVDLSDLTEEDAGSTTDEGMLLDESELSSHDGHGEDGGGGDETSLVLTPRRRRRRRASSSSSPSPSSLAKLAARRERRMHLDLAKHQQLLVDSQKMNQSLKRCLDWTDELIRQGQRALDYTVRVSDVQFGGRVLAPPDEEEDEDAGEVEDEDAGQAVDGHAGAVSHQRLVLGDEPLLAPPWIKGPQDRDSGIELRVDGG